jgi:NAD(P)-dependent dehydrogenase (short-subunit alcohol dehydrogenase family)
LGILGRGFCRGLAAFGANVVIADLDEAEAQKFADEIMHETGNAALGVGCNVADEISVERMVDRAVERFGGVDILHNNAASKSDELSKFFAPFEDYSIDEWRKIMSVNLDGMYLVAKYVGNQMVRQGRGGSIVQTASIYGIMGSDKRIYEGSQYMGMQINNPAVYSASKAGVVGLTRWLATYWADKNIRVNCLVPGGVESGQNNTFKQRYSERIPMGRMARADEMVGALVYLASDASSYVTGHVLVVDGGLNAW